MASGSAPTTSEFAEFADSLKERGERAERSVGAALRAVITAAPEDIAERLLDVSFSLNDTFRDIDAAADEIRAQNDELFAAQVQLEADSERYRVFFELAPLPYLVTDADASIRLANAAACALLRRPKNALAGQPLVRFVLPSEREFFRGAVRRSTAATGLTAWPVRLVPTGSPEPVECRVYVRTMVDGASDKPTLFLSLTEEPGETLF